MEVSGVISTGSSLIATGGRLMTLPSEEYRLIPLTRGQFAKVSPEDFEWINQWKWYASTNNHGMRYEAYRNTPRKLGKHTSLKMHRVIVGAPVGTEVDHINGDPLDNRRSNLRVTDRANNARNVKTHRDNVSGLKGVSFHQCTGRWRARIFAQGKEMSLGVYDTKEEAHEAYCAASKHYHGEFSRTK